MLIRKSKKEIEIMKEAGKIVCQVLDLIESLIKPGITTEFLDKEAEKFILNHNAIPIFKGYNGFPNTICASINEEIVHGLPSKRKLKEGDIVSIDVGVKYNGYIGDAARTFGVGNISKLANKLIKVCKECLYLGIKSAIPGNRISDISRAIQIHAEKNGFSVVKEYTGHGVGTSLHEDPQVPNYVDEYWTRMSDIILKPGYCLAIEPMVNVGTYKTKTVRRKGWDVVLTKDEKLSAHFEHTIAILEEGPIILTQL